MPGTESRHTLLDRRELVALGAGAFAVAMLPFALRRSRRRVVRRTVPVMGTLAELAVVTGDRRRARAAIDAGIAELRAVDRLMTRFSDRSEVGRLNLAAARAPVAVSRPTARVVEEALRWAEATDGAFDPCLGRAVELWDVNHRLRPPSERDVARLAGRRLFRSLELDCSGPRARVLFRDADTALDLGGIAKGYAVDRAVAALRRHGIRDGLVNAGGDLYALGRSGDGDPWRVGVRSPLAPDELSGSFELEDKAAATSGDYEQYFRFRDHRYHHLLDPATGAPRETAVHSVTVVAADCLAADAGATAAFNLAPARARTVLAARGAHLVS